MFVGSGLAGFCGDNPQVLTASLRPFNWIEDNVKPAVQQPFRHFQPKFMI